MREEDEIMDELHELNGELRSFPPDAHWFCPKRYDDDPIEYDIPDDPEEVMSPETKHELIQEGKRRHKVAYKYSLILGLPQDATSQLLEKYTRQLDVLLQKCDKCVRNWHMGRKPYLKELAEQLDEDTIAELAERLNMLDFKRLDSGLKVAQKLLAEVEPSKRTQSILMPDPENPVALLALYEALCCVAYHSDETRLARYFNYVFAEVQTKKALRLGDILPAMSRFLFSDDAKRLRFATHAWQKMKLELSPESFEWVVHDNLAEQMRAVCQPSVQLSDIEDFWRGFLLMLNKMDQKIIAHSLRAMEAQPDIYFLALQHLTSCDSVEISQLIVKTFRHFFRKAPKDLWSALGAISPKTFAEQIFGSPGFKKMVREETHFESYPDSPATAWIPEYIESLAPDHRHDACQSLLYNLLERMQVESIPEESKLACCRAGLNSIHVTLQIFISTDYRINPSTSLIVIDNILGLVDLYKKTIIGCADLHDGGPHDSVLKRLGMLVIQDALALDCKAISAEYFAMENGTEVQRVTRTHSESIWQAVLDIFRPGSIELAKSILAATSALTGLDELRPLSKKQIPPLPKNHVQFNEDFQELNDNVSKVFERLSDFSSSDLQSLYRHDQTARPLFAALVSAHQGTYEATMELVKAMTGQSGKQDAISSLLDQALVPMLNSLTSAVENIRRSRVFGPMPNMIKLEREILKALCGNTGILRTRSNLSKAEQNAVMGWWSCQWRIIDVFFFHFESWSSRVSQSTKELQNICRDGMEYAEDLLNKYNVVASALGNPSSSDDDSSSDSSGSAKAALRRVLNVVCQNVIGLTMLLRLRDTYLVAVITSLLSKLLRSLGDYGLEVDDKTSTYIKDACKRENEVGFKRTNLTNQQKAELQRALYEHQGVEVVEILRSSATAKTQGTIDAWSRSADGKKFEPKVPAQSLTAERQKAAQEKLRVQAAIPERSSTDFRESRRKAAEERKQQNLEAIARAKALRGPAGIKGEGSGLKDIGGIAGKDHAPTRSEIMVGSSDDESDDDDEDETNALVKIQKGTSKKVSEYEESRRLALKKMQQGPVKKTKVQRSAKDLRARVEPNMDALYTQILSWDLFHTGNTPPGNVECRKIADSFQDLSLYKNTFLPLLISEVWQSILTAKEENNPKPIKIKVLNRLSVDKFMEVSTSMSMATSRDLKLSEREIILLSKSPDPMNNPQVPHCLARVDRTNRKKDIIEVTFRVSRTNNSDFAAILAPNTEIYAAKIIDMTTTQREYASLSSLEYYDLCMEVLAAKPSPLQKYTDDKIASMSSKYTLNRGQAQAILSANDNDGFTLIQGPPGSGKTKTIVAMVGALLTQSLQQQQAEHAKARPQERNQSAAPPAPKKKLLVCAPSNAAVDELVVRLMEGVQPLNGPRRKINVIRIGRSEAISAGAKEVVLEELVRQKLEGTNSETNKFQAQRDKLHQDAAKIKERLNVLRPMMDEALNKGDKSQELNLRREFDTLKRSQAHIGAKIDEDKESGNTVTRQNEINRRRFQQEILDGAHVLCATLSGSGHDMFRNLNVEFETVLIDEAAQCIELSALIPLKYGCSKCILVGDPEQLPPTVLSRSAQNFGYEQSLFVRMQRNHPNDVHLLDTQYRMHPDISVFPSQQFYGSRLIDGEDMAKLRDKPWHASSTLGPYRFFDVKGVQTKESRGHSFINIPELNAAMKLYDRLKTDYASVNLKGMIGIIATYKAQLNELRNRFVQRYGETIFDEIEFNTTDAFQGREREIIIFSCVRATQSGGIGFLKDIRRMNVGLTRAKSSLWVLGDSRSLQQGEFWNRLIEDAKRRDRYTGGDVLAFLSKPTARDRKNPRESLPVPRPQFQTTSTTDNNAYPGRSIYDDDKDSDVEMLDAPPDPGSFRKSSSASNGSLIEPQPNGDRLQNPTIKQEKYDVDVKNEDTNVTASSGSGTSIEMNSHGKRPRQGSLKDEDGLVVQNQGLKIDNLPDLDAALAAHHKAKLATSAVRPPRPPAVGPPRKKAAADPFIQKKKPRR